MGTLAAASLAASSSSSTESTSTPPGHHLPGILSRLDLDVDIVQVDLHEDDDDNNSEEQVVQQFHHQRHQKRRKGNNNYSGGGNSAVNLVNDEVGRKRRELTIIDRIVGEETDRAVVKNKKARFSSVLSEEEVEQFAPGLTNLAYVNLSAASPPRPIGNMVNVQHHNMVQNGGLVPKQMRALPALSPIQQYVSDGRSRGRGGGGSVLQGGSRTAINQSISTSFSSIGEMASFFMAKEVSGPVPAIRRRKSIEPVPRRRSAPSSSPIVTVTPVRHSANDGSLGERDGVVLVEGMMQPGKKNHNKIKRPLNAFMVWSKLQRRKIMDDDSTVHHSVISKQLGAGWKALSEEERRPFYEEAQRLGKLHNHLYPDYKYRPRRRQNLSSSVTTTTTTTPQLLTSSSSSFTYGSYHGGRPASASPPFASKSTCFIPSISQDGSLDLSMKSGQSHSSDEGNLVEVTPTIYHDEGEEQDDEEYDEVELPLDMSCSSRSESESKKSWSVIQEDESGDDNNPDEEDEDRLIIDES